MGISGVYKEIGPGQRISLAKLAADTLEKKGRPLRIAIDTSIWLYQVQSSKGGSNPPLRTFYYRLIRLLSLAIHPVFVFDGPHKPKFKRNKKVGNQAGTIPEYMARQMCSFFSYSTHKAPGEAEAECALLQREGIVDVVWSEDVDTLMFGSGQTIRNWSSEGRSSVSTHVNLYDSTLIKAESGLDREGMILVALMSGGDYLPAGLPGCGPVVACEAARAGFGHELCSIRDGDTTALTAWRTRLIHELRTNENKIFKRKPRAIEVPDDFPNKEVLKFYTHPALSSAEDMADLKTGLCEVLEARTSGADMIALKTAWKKDKTKSKIYPSLRTFFDLPFNLSEARTFTADAFDWRTVSGAKHFIRSLAPALLVRELRLGRIAEGESALLFSVSSIREHASTDMTPEMRVEYIPLNVVPLDLDAEDPDESEIGSNPTIATTAAGSDDELTLGDDGDEESRPTRLPANFDPTKLVKTWIISHIVKNGAPEIAAEWEAKQKAKAAKAIKKTTRKPLRRAATDLGLTPVRGSTSEFLDEVPTLPIRPFVLPRIFDSQPAEKRDDNQLSVEVSSDRPTRNTIRTLDMSANSTSRSKANANSEVIPTKGRRTGSFRTGSPTKVHPAGSSTKGHVRDATTEATAQLDSAGPPRIQSGPTHKRGPSFQAPVLDLSERLRKTKSTTSGAPTDISRDSRANASLVEPSSLSTMMATPVASRGSVLADRSSPWLSTPVKTSRTPFRRIETAPSSLQTPPPPNRQRIERSRPVDEDPDPIDDFLDGIWATGQGRTRAREGDERTGVSPDKKKTKTLAIPIIPPGKITELSNPKDKLSRLRSTLSRPAVRVGIRDLDLDALSDLDELPELDLNTPQQPRKEDKKGEAYPMAASDSVLDCIQSPAVAGQISLLSSMRESDLDEDIPFNHGWDQYENEGGFLNDLSLEDTLDDEVSTVFDRPEIQTPCRPLDSKAAQSNYRNLDTPVAISRQKDVSKAIVLLLSSSPPSESVTDMKLPDCTDDDCLRSIPDIPRPVLSLKKDDGIQRKGDINPKSDLRAEVTPPPRFECFDSSYSTPAVTPTRSTKRRINSRVNERGKLPLLYEDDEGEVTILDGGDENGEVDDHTPEVNHLSYSEVSQPRQGANHVYSSPPMSPSSVISLRKGGVPSCNTGQEGCTNFQSVDQDEYADSGGFIRSPTQQPRSGSPFYITSTAETIDHEIESIVPEIKEISVQMAKPRSKAAAAAAAASGSKSNHRRISKSTSSTARRPLRPRPLLVPINPKNSTHILLSADGLTWSWFEDGRANAVDATPSISTPSRDSTDPTSATAVKISAGIPFLSPAILDLSMIVVPTDPNCPSSI